MSRLTIRAVILLLAFSLAACTAPGPNGVDLLGQDCATSADCGGSPCVPVGGARRACTDDCVTDGECAAGWACGEFGGVGTVCRCDARPEVCDDRDNDCDGLIDEDCGAATCGDGACGGSEDCSNCVEDCGACAPGCGDFVCTEDESCATCSPDCGPCAAECGDGLCNEGEETCESCGEDCGPCLAVCGDGMCDAPGESCGTCEADCGLCCEDAGEEPNDTESAALRQDRPAPWGCVYEDTFGGVLSGSTDEDWFTVLSGDTRFGGCSHSVTVNAPGITLCIFGSCATLDSTPSTSCPAGTLTISPDGAPGCCTTGGPATMRIECRPGASTVTEFFVQVGGAAASECLPYDVTFAGTTP